MDKEGDTQSMPLDMETLTLISKNFQSEFRRALLNTLYELRITHGLTQQDVANLLQCSRVRISNIERRKSNSAFEIGELDLLSLRYGFGDVVRLVSYVYQLHPSLLETYQKLSSMLRPPQFPG